MRKNDKQHAALFDLDGVVFDTEPQYTVFWGSQCRLYHPEAPGLEHRIKGSTLDQIFDAHWSGALEKERVVVTERLNAFESQMHFDYVAGFEAFVADLRRNGVKTAVVTSSNRLKMDSVYNSHPEFTGLFDCIFTSEDFSESKPSPDCYLTAARYFGIEPTDCAVFEDSINGLRSGMAAGMVVVGLTTTNPDEVVKPLSNYQLKDYTDLNYQYFKALWQVI